MNFYETNRHNDFFGNWQGYNEAVKKYTGTGKKIVVCLAGSSFDECIGEIKYLNREDYLLFCCDIVYFRLIKEHLIPDLVFTLDAYPWFKAGFWGKKSGLSGLVTFVGCNPDNLQGWKGKKYIYRLVCTGNNEIDTEVNNAQNWFDSGYGFQYESRHIGEVILRFCNDIKADTYWIGLDFGKIDGKAYARGITEKKDEFERKKFDYSTFQYRAEGEGTFLNFDSLYQEFAGSFLNILNMYEYGITNMGVGGMFDYINPQLTRRIKRLAVKEFVDGFKNEA